MMPVKRIEIIIDALELPAVLKLLDAAGVSGLYGYQRCDWQRRARDARRRRIERGFHQQLRDNRLPARTSRGGRRSIAPDSQTLRRRVPCFRRTVADSLITAFIWNGNDEK